VRTRFSARPD